MSGDESGKSRDDTGGPKGCWYWTVATVVVTVLLIGIPQSALFVIRSRGADPMVILGLLVSAPGVALVSIGWFRPDLLLRGFRTQTPEDRAGATSEARLVAIFQGAAFIGGGMAFAATGTFLYLLLSIVVPAAVVALLALILSNGPPG
ncbi:MAG TPA: hypothetical protein ENK19_03290 [Acidobacteria bacterium]|nr:hypothetical protein [Acidobacteriota bacterium]